MKKIFDPKDFVPTNFSTAAYKAAFGDKLIDLITTGYARTKFSKSFYSRLNRTFGHIAHYNIDGFYDTWFENKEKQEDFLRNLINYPCYGDPSYTFSDVESAIQKHVRRHPTLTREVSTTPALKG